ncbi:Gpi anchored protein [Pleurostoma richardsiae]|uniref:Gpi anchored protein n=1 Tax=Pleurostoma richardsiae TaxID=41990 RepID=A0AA38VKN9_9PEZI|nr:Gpi anchored protein [Pleurostoma richardsiae]
MRSALLSLAILPSLIMAAEEAHGEGAEGSIMGPVAFLWPDDRPWSADADNTAPCGSSSGVVNRTIFPLSQGSVALSIADDAYDVEFSISYSSNPTAQSDFTQEIVEDVAEVEPGHQCYKIAAIPSTVTAGTNATIQLEYWAKYDSENGGNNQSFYACADITFVEASDFDIQVPCFNVTADDFSLPASTSSAATSAATPAATSAATGAAASATEAATSSKSSSDGLSGGAKAGIAVGVVVASLLIVAAIAFVVFRRRKSHKAEPTLPTTNMKQTETHSVRSA